MLTTIKDKNGYICAFCDWMVVNKDGTLNDKGEYVYIKDIWVHEDYHFKKLINMLTKRINENPLTFQATDVYWNRFLKDGKQRIYKKEKLLKLLLGGS